MPDFYSPEDRKNYAREHYQNNKEKYMAKSRDFKTRRREQWKEFKSGLKCSVCGENHPACLEFHHHGDDKDFNVGTRVWNTAWETLMAEVAKCEVLCANCHRKLHHP